MYLILYAFKSVYYSASTSVVHVLQEEEKKHLVTPLLNRIVRCIRNIMFYAYATCGHIMFAYTTRPCRGLTAVTVLRVTHKAVTIIE